VPYKGPQADYKTKLYDVTLITVAMAHTNTGEIVRKRPTFGKGI
jgi:hypothetical protein